MPASSWREAARQQTAWRQIEANTLDGADLTYPLDMARELAERHARDCPDFHLLMTRDAGLFRRLAHKLPGWKLTEITRRHDRYHGLMARLERIEDRETLQNLHEGYEAIAFAYAAAAYLIGFETGKLAEKRTRTC